MRQAPRGGQALIRDGAPPETDAQGPSTASTCQGCGASCSPFDPRCARCGALLCTSPGEAAESGSLAPGPPPEPAPAPVVTITGPPPPASPGPGDRLGRFEIVGELGAGAMGVVVRARDPLLDREVAIKVVRPEALGGEGSGDARARLVREAQAMAKLTHPNVVAVHEVDLSDGDVLVVMEYVEGRTLRAFCQEGRPAAGEILRVFLEAGRGLAAVHRAGFVHRDFKPENVIVGTSGRARVTDFGLVGRDAGEPEKEGASPLGGGLSTRVTRSGALLGTPAYMAPEQHLREPADARADQFAFCVALWEALAGERPFAGETYAELRASVLGGRIRPPPRGSLLSPRIRAALARGLSVDREARYPDMDGLLSELSRDPGPRRRRAALLAGALAAVIGAFFVARRSPVELCRGGEERLAGVWDAATKDRVRRSFLETNSSYAEETYRRVEQALDERTRAWTAMYTDSCEATNVRGEQSAELLDRRTACLERRLDEVRALTGLFARGPDADVLERAVNATLALPGLSACADATALSQATPLPEDTAVRARVEALRARLDQASALDGAGKYDEGLAIARPLVEEANATGFAPAQAEALSVLGRLQRDVQDTAAAEETLREAARAAALAKDDVRAAEAWTDLVHVVGVQQARYPAALDMRLAAEGAALRAGGQPRLSARLLGTLGAVLDGQGEHARAEELLERAIGMLEKAGSPGDAELSTLLLAQCEALDDLERYEDAQRACLRAIDLREKGLGADHPGVAAALVTMGTLRNDEGKNAEAVPYLERAIAIYDRARLGERPALASALNNLGNAKSLLGEYEVAFQCHQRALAIREKALGKEHFEVGTSLNNMGTVLESMGKNAEAVPYLERALAVREKALGRDHVRVAVTLLNLAWGLVAQGKFAEALPHLERALAIREKVNGPTSFAVAEALGEIALCRVNQKDFAGAVAPIERALAIYAGRSKDESDPADLAQLRFTAAQALWGAGRDRAGAAGGRGPDAARALDLAKKARDAWAELGGGYVKHELPDVKAWLAERGVR